MMELPPVALPRWANAEQTAVDCIVTLDDADLPFTASASDPEELGQAIFAAAVAGDLGEVAAYEAPPPPEPSVPQVVSPRQIRLAMLAAGVLPQVQAFVDGPDASEAVRIAWEYATEFHRDDAMIEALAPMLNLTPGDIDNLFIAAAAIR